MHTMNLTWNHCFEVGRSQEMQWAISRNACIKIDTLCGSTKAGIFCQLFMYTGEKDEKLWVTIESAPDSLFFSVTDAIESNTKHQRLCSKVHLDELTTYLERICTEHIQAKKKAEDEDANVSAAANEENVLAGW